MSEQFSISIDKFVKKAQGNTDRFMLEFTQDIAENVVTKSPVDTGFFRSNWKANIGSVEIGPERKPKDFNLGASAATSQALGNITANLIGVDGGDVVYITNNADYARKLEYGWSNQAPEGMVRITIAKAPSIAREVLKRINK
jgi:hypothetical protein